jgi:hypothetical protein
MEQYITNKAYAGLNGMKLGGLLKDADQLSASSSRTPDVTFPAPWKESNGG